jgi:2-dehydro-3-deoxyphosphogluconate aldolase/(4S)-4-hydroxy-2-oxoglutarate aldolase
MEPEMEICKLQEKIEQTKIIAVIIIDKAKDAVPLANTLMKNGVNIIELTLRTDAAPDAIKAIKKELPEMIVGAGTVLTKDQVKQVVDCGVDFAVAPGCNPTTLKAAKDNGLTFAPGIQTASEIECALEFGCKLLKYFPAETTGGIKNLKSLNAPYSHLGLKYIPLGGIKTANVRDYLSQDFVAGIGGSWLAPKKDIIENNWETIGRNTAEAVKIAKEF